MSNLKYIFYIVGFTSDLSALYNCSTCRKTNINILINEIFVCDGPTFEKQSFIETLYLLNDVEHFIYGTCDTQLHSFIMARTRVLFHK